MPIENECKYVLDKGIVLSEDSVEIQQGYLPGCHQGVSIRIRSYNGRHFSFTYKLEQEMGGKCVEIETDIEEDDYNLLWKATSQKLLKHRHFFGDDDGWVADRFLDSNGDCYFVLAECEIPQNHLRPKHFPATIPSNMIHEVPRDEHFRFSSYALSNIDYAKKLYDELKRGKDA